MKAIDGYNHWAESYDSVKNATRDLEAVVLKAIFENKQYDHIIELGCGTGKNTLFLSQRANRLTAVDFSELMLLKAREKVRCSNLCFNKADITLPWQFEKADLITCSLVLEHVQNLNHVFIQAYGALKDYGHFYICELHPYRQMSGSNARFVLDEKTIDIENYQHNISEYMQFAISNGFYCIDMKEWFDDDVGNKIPRLCSFLFQKT